MFLLLLNGLNKESKAKKIDTKNTYLCVCVCINSEDFKH